MRGFFEEVMGGEFARPGARPKSRDASLRGYPLNGTAAFGFLAGSVRQSRGQSLITICENDADQALLFFAGFSF